MQVTYYELLVILFWITFGGFDRKKLPDIWNYEEKVVPLRGEILKLVFLCVTG